MNNSKKMRKKIFEYFELAGNIAVSKKDQRTFLLASIGIRKDGTVVTAINGPSHAPLPAAHSERRLTKKLDYGAIVYVARIRIGDGEFANSRPCRNCLKALISKKVSRVYYTISSIEYGVINLAGKTIRDIDNILNC